jgi:hypothetical protein
MTLTPKPGEIRKGHGKVKRYPAEKTHRTCKLFTKFRIVSLQLGHTNFSLKMLHMKIVVGQSESMEPLINPRTPSEFK